MKLTKYKLIINRLKITLTKKNHSNILQNRDSTGGLVLGLGAGIRNYDVAKEHSDYLVSIAGNPVKSFSILTGRDSRY